MDCKAHRKEKQLEIIHLHIENQHLDLAVWGKPFAEQLQEFIRFNGCTSLKIASISPQHKAKTILQFLRSYVAC